MRMNKGVVFSLLLLFISLAACKRSHMCYCKVSGTFDTTLIKEYRGYSKKEARQLCKSDELVSNNNVRIECDIFR